MASRNDRLRPFAGGLSELRIACGQPSYTELHRRAPALSKSTIGDVLTGKSRPTIDFVLAFVAACRRYALDNGIDVEPALCDPDVWRARWMRLQRDLGAIRRDATAATGADCLTIDRRIPRARDLDDPRLLGVHSAAGDGTAPAYVLRDADAKLRRRLREPGFVLLVAESAAGKSRSAYEAVRAVLPDHPVLVPTRPSALRGLLDHATGLDRAVLWLDDLERYLGPDGLTRNHIAAFTAGAGHHRVVLATIRTSEAARYTALLDERARPLLRDGIDVLDLAVRVPLNRLFSPPEKARAGRVADGRIADALRHADTLGLAEYLAAGPALLTVWRDGLAAGVAPRGAALVSAAVDCRRAGMTRPLPRRLLERLAGDYLAAAGIADAEPVDEAWAWATADRHATTSLLTAVDDDGYQVFDYLIDAVDGGPASFVPESTLAAALAHASAEEASRVGAVAYAQGLFAIAADAHRHAYRLRVTTLGDDDPATLDSRDRYGSVLRACGRLADAETVLREVGEARTRVLGAAHPDTLTSRNNLAAVLYLSGAWAEAEIEFRAVLSARVDALGEDDTETIRSRSNHAAVLYDLGRWDEAETQARSALRARERRLGATDPATLVSRNNYALVLHALGRWAEAEVLHHETWQARELVLGPEHPDTLESRHNHATSLRMLGRAAEAETIRRAVWSARRTVLGEQHYDTIDTHGHLAADLAAIGRWHEAETEIKAAHAVAYDVLGPEHPYTVDILDTYAVILDRLGRHAEAREHAATADEARARRLGVGSQP